MRALSESFATSAWCQLHGWLPAELLDNIVGWLLAHKHTFSSISAFSLVSRLFRQVALRHYYVSLHVRSGRHWVRSCHITGMFTWVRSLVASTAVFRYKLDGLVNFSSLRTIELDFSGDGLSTQTSRANLLFKNMTADLTRITLTHLPRIDATLLCTVASRFPSLVVLDLSCVERLDEHCCWRCLEESSTCCEHSPIPDVFATPDLLVIKVCKALKAVKQLERLRLGIFLSDADVLVRHLERCAAVLIPSPRTGYYSAPPFCPDKCAICHAEHGQAVREREQHTRAMFRRLLPSIQVVEFSSWFANEVASEAENAP